MKKILSKLLVVFFLIATIYSCGSIMRSLYGIKDPSVKTEKQIRRYIKKIDMNPENQYGLEFNSFAKKMKQSKKLPKILLFNKHGELLLPTDTNTNSCNGKVGNYLHYLDDPTVYYSVPDSTTFESYTKGLTDLSGNKVDKIDINNYDIVAVITWATYLGKLNKDSPLRWENTLNKYQNPKILIIKMNFDFRDFWDEQDIKKVDRSYNKK